MISHVVAHEGGRRAGGGRCGGRSGRGGRARSDQEGQEGRGRRARRTTRRRKEVSGRRPMPDGSSFWSSAWAIPGRSTKIRRIIWGFMVIDRLAESHAIRVSRKENFSLVGLGTIRGKRVALAKPQTFMNLSGPAVKGLLERYELTPGPFDFGVRRAGSSVERAAHQGRKVRRRGITE